MRESASWRAFEVSEPELAAIARRLLYPIGPNGPGLGFLATTRADGGPRVHPVCPALHGDGLYVFVIGASPKRADLARDGRYALHAFPAKADDESFYCIGPALEVKDPALRRAVESAVVHSVRPDEVLFELRLAHVLHTTWLRPRQPDTQPVYRRWQP
jgi:hypothetical protein